MLASRGGWRPDAQIPGTTGRGVHTYRVVGGARHPAVGGGSDRGRPADDRAEWEPDDQQVSDSQAGTVSANFVQDVQGASAITTDSTVTAPPSCGSTAPILSLQWTAGATLDVSSYLVQPWGSTYGLVPVPVPELRHDARDDARALARRPEQPGPPDHRCLLYGSFVSERRRPLDAYRRHLRVTLGVTAQLTGNQLLKVHACRRAGRRVQAITTSEPSSTSTTSRAPASTTATRWAHRRHAGAA